MKHLIHTTTRLSLRLLLLAVFLTALLAVNSPITVFAACDSSGSPVVSTDQADYPPFGIAIISGSGFGCGEILSVLVTAPDGSTYSADGSGANGPDLVTTDENGSFVLNYALFGTLPDGGNYLGQEGEYYISVTNVDGMAVASATFTDGAIARHICVVTTGSGVKCWGVNVHGQLGDGTTSPSSTPVNVIGLTSGVIQTSLGVAHTCALTTSGGVKCWGVNVHGQLGDGTTNNSSTPVDVIELTSGVTQISAAPLHTCALMASGAVKCWGENSFGQLGDGTAGPTHSSTTPVDVIGLTSGMTQISAAFFHTCALTTSGGVKCWGGDNRVGILGDGTTNSSSTPVDVSGLTSGVTQVYASSLGRWGYTCALTTSGGVKCWGRGPEASNPSINSLTPVDMSGLTSGVALLPDILGRINQPPTANAGGPYLGAVNSALQFDGNGSSDPEGDSLTYAWDFGDGNSSGGVAPAYAYTVPGIYDVCLTVNDGSLDSEADCTLAVVYDPEGGFVTGGGWIDSPAGAYTADPSLTGKATFGFVSKYQKGATVPSGNTEFQFQAGGFNFRSDTYEWLVVNQNGTNAQFKGSGTVNGALDPNGDVYKFMLWAGDGSPDTFRIQIWYEDNSGEHVVYDNGFDQTIGGGSIVVHNK